MARRLHPRARPADQGLARVVRQPFCARRPGPYTAVVPGTARECPRVPRGLRGQKDGERMVGTQSLSTRGPGGSEPPEASRQTVPVGKRTALEAQEKVVPRRTGIRAAGRSCSVLASRGGKPMRYYVGVDWADAAHAIWVVDEAGGMVTKRTVAHSAEGLSEWSRELDEWRAQGIELWAAIERPAGRVVDFLLDHGVVVYPLNPKALDRARDRFRQSGAKSDPYDARVAADFLRTDQGHLTALQPSSTAVR